MTRRQIGILIVAAVVAVALIWFLFLRGGGVPGGFAASNGRLEATDYYISAKRAGRVSEVLNDEGDTVEAGQVVAKMDTEELDAALREAQAKIVLAEAQRKVAEANKAYAEAQVTVREATLKSAQATYDRAANLVKTGGVSQQEYETDLGLRDAAAAEVLGAKAQVAQAESQIESAAADIDAGKASVDRLQAELKDAVLVAPIRGRIERRLAEPGEVLPSGGRVLSMIDLSDVYMYVFLPTEVAGKVQMGSDARIVLDAAPDNPIAASVSYVSPEAQFTPKTVETAEERFNLTFRVKLQIPAERLREFEPLVKSGIPGLGYVRIDAGASWPDSLEPKGPPSWATTGKPTEAKPAGQ